MNDIVPSSNDANLNDANLQEVSGSQVNFIGRFSLGDGQTNFGNCNHQYVECHLLVVYILITVTLE